MLIRHRMYKMPITIYYNGIPLTKIADTDAWIYKNILDMFRVHGLHGLRTMFTIITHAIATDSAPDALHIYNDILVRIMLALESFKGPEVWK